MPEAVLLLHFIGRRKCSEKKREPRMDTDKHGLKKQRKRKKNSGGAG